MQKENSDKQEANAIKPDAINSNLGGKHTDEELLQHYKLGWNDCADNKPTKIFSDKLFQTAYTNGRIDFIVGDDIRSIDYQTEEKILQQIKG